MSYLDWKAGDKIVCVDDRWSIGGKPPVVAGHVYEISEIWVSARGWTDVPNAGRVVVKLVGVNWDKLNASRFRPVQTRATDISVFTALLNPTPHDKHLIEVHDFVSVQGDLQ